MTQTRVLVLGASGNTGEGVVMALNAHHSTRVRTATRAVELPTSPEHTRFDWSQSQNHEAVLDGIERIYLVAPAGVVDPIAVVEPFLALAVKAGVQRVVMLSSSAVETGEPGLGQIDALVRDVIPEWAILRPSWFMQNFVGDHPLAESIRKERRFVTATGAGRLGFIDAQDIGQAAAALLSADTLESGVHVLTGPESLSYSDAAGVVSDVVGSPITHLSVTPDEYAAILTDAGYDVGFAALLAGLDERISSGAQDVVTDSVEKLTGTKPRSFVDFVKENEHRL